MTMQKENLAAYPRLVKNDEASSTASLSASFYAQFPALFINQRRSSNNIWPEHSENAAARQAYKDGYNAIHTDGDLITAIRCYENALELDPMYIRVWVDLGIALLLDNTIRSIDRAEGIFARLCEITPDGVWLTSEVASIFRQNLGYVSVLRYRETGDTVYLNTARTEYLRADALAEQERIGLLCPWAFVMWELGDASATEQLWERAKKAAPSTEVLSEYTAKYASLNDFLGVKK
jgi:tetratricopeptide (TPR) repeat protein